MPEALRIIQLLPCTPPGRCRESYGQVCQRVGKRVVALDSTLVRIAHDTVFADIDHFLRRIVTAAIREVQIHGWSESDR